MIDLGKFSSATIVLSGRTKGEKIREELHLKENDEKPDLVEVVVPSEIVSMNSSFFLGLFGPSVLKLGEERFKKKYQFKAHDVILEDVYRGIRDALKSHMALV